MNSYRFESRWWLWVAIVAVSVTANTTARGDRVQLKGGGEVKGVLVDDPVGRPGMVGLLTEKTVTPLPLKKEQIARVVEEPGPLREYLTRRDQAEPTGQAQFDLGLWCERQKLPGPAQIQFRKAFAIDPEFVPARQKLGHVQVGDQWMTPEEAREAKGLVAHKGRWVTPDEKDRREVEAATATDLAALTRRLQGLRQALKSEKPDVRRQAEEELVEIKDVGAIGSMVKVFGREIPTLRVLLLRVLDAIEGPEASGALVGQYLIEPDPKVRAVGLEILTRRPQREVQPKLLQGLKSKHPDAIGQAAVALAEVKAQTAVPNLVSVLVQTRDHMEFVPMEVPARSGPTFVSGTSYTYAAQAIPVTAPGAVAFNIVPGQILDGVAMGNTGGTKIVPHPSLIREFLPNRAVHDALVRLTGQDFGYDANAWRRWLASGQRIALPERRVTEP